ncbi:MAG: hypothetical protein CME59_20320 [Halioglobus sp.]|nr:hypothetical protein [Halioglobus sp.]|tara:strand:+ start:2451 stop:2897 length:447 start_codon:yes stop_codon:yes gene_type:complete
MSEESTTSCVLIPISSAENWAVPQNCLAEILTVNADADTPPESVSWRGRDIPVLDFGADSGARWMHERIHTGLVAVFLGLAGEGCEYWGVALRGEGLAVARLDGEQVTDVPDSVAEHASAAFRFRDSVYQVPDLDGLQKKLAASVQAA